MTVIQPTALVAVHAQLEPVMTEILPLLPVEGTVTFVGDTLVRTLSLGWRRAEDYGECDEHKASSQGHGLKAIG